MAEYLVWLIVSSVTMIALYGCYVAMLGRMCQPVFNRGVLLAIYVISFASLFLYQWLFRRPVDPDAPVTITLMGSISKVAEARAMIAITIFSWLYIAGVAIVVLRRIREWVIVKRLIARGESRRCEDFKLVLIDDEDISPFSLRRTVVVSRKDMDDVDGNMILAHERSHIKACHWIDLLIADIVVAIQWFNPAAWMIRNELKNVHEYQADECVMASGYDAKAYQLMLIGKAVGRRVCFSGNSLGYGKLKRRVHMMAERQTGLSTKLRVLVMLPVLTALAFASNTAYCRRFFNEIGVVIEVNQQQTNSTEAVANPSDKTFSKVIVDGQEVDKSMINEINPNDIKSITVLKDENSEGTIIIETKK